MEVPSKVDEFLKNKESVEKVVVGGGEARGVDEYDSNRVILVLKEGGVVPYSDTTPDWVVSIGAFIKSVFDYGSKKVTVHRSLFTSNVHRLLFTDVDEDIGVDEPSSEIDSVFVIGESDVESMVVPRKFGEFLKNKESMKRLLWVVVKHMGLMSLREEFVFRVLEGRDVSDEKSREVFSVTPHATKGRRRVLCYVQGNGRRKKKKMEAAYQRRLCDLGIKSVFQNNTLRASEHDVKDALSELLQIGPTTQTIISLRSEVASPVFKGSLDVDEDISVDEASSAIENVFVIGESDVESMEVPC
nr:hypothetical protein [Tanacetum cinerariifolium]